MTEQINEKIEQIIQRVEHLEREVLFLRASVRNDVRKDAVRVFPNEIARRFGVSSWTVRRMQGEFAGLQLIKKVTQTGRIYFNRKEYEKWLAEREKQSRRRLFNRRIKEK